MANAYSVQFRSKPGASIQHERVVATSESNAIIYIQKKYPGCSIMAVRPA